MACNSSQFSFDSMYNRTQNIVFLGIIADVIHCTCVSMATVRVLTSASRHSESSRFICVLCIYVTGLRCSALTHVCNVCMCWNVRI